MNRKQRRAALKSANKATGFDPQVNAVLAAAIRHHDAGRLRQAEELYRDVLKQRPDLVHANLHLGRLLMDTGRMAEAVAPFERMTALMPDVAETHMNLGFVLAQLGRSAEAIACYHRSLRLKPLPKAHNGLGVVLMQADGHSAEALSHFEQALALDPGFVEAHNNVAILLAARGDSERAAQAFRRVVEARPDFLEAHENLARALLACGEGAQALATLVRAFRIRETPDLQKAFVHCLKEVPIGAADADLRDLIVRALNAPWGRPIDLARAGAALVRANSDLAPVIARAVAAWPQRLSWADLFGTSGAQAAADDGLLRALLETARVVDVDIERFLACARAAMLDRAQQDGPEPTDAELEFLAALAAQCFNSDYVFDVSDQELKAARELSASMAAALEQGTPIPPLQLIAVAAYLPLHALPAAGDLLKRPWPWPIEALVARQVREPRAEQALRLSIPQLTPIEDDVSRSVRQQYEQNPYPRWVKAPPPRRSPSLDHYVREMFPHAPYRNLGKGGRIDILIAGCGTGQHAVELAQRFGEARILACDLSLASIAYARRKAEEIGLRNMEFAQADILELGGIDRRFDLVESNGVLHHLADPFAGWRVLRSLVRRGGLMNIGLYSARAREDVSVARELIAARGYGATADDIRRFRQELMSDGDPQFRGLVASPDFFNLSDCRDLLFHVREERLTLPQIKEFCTENALQLLGFELNVSLTAQYAARFPDDRAQTDFDNWHAFETENPDTFRGMYQLWLQTAGSP